MDESDSNKSDKTNSNSDNSDNFDSSNNSDDSDGSDGSNESDNSDSSNNYIELNSKKKKSSKSKNKTKSNKSNKFNNNRANTNDNTNEKMISVKDITIDKLENKLRYTKLDLSNAQIRISKLENELENKNNKIKKTDIKLCFVSKCIKFIEKNYIWEVDDLIDKQVFKTNPNIIPNPIFGTDFTTNDTEIKNSNQKLLTSVKARLNQIWAYEKFSNFNFLSLDKINKILYEYKETKKQILLDYESICRVDQNYSNDSSSNTDFNSESGSESNSNKIINHFNRRIVMRKDSLIKALDKKITYYEYMKTVEEIASRIAISLLLIIFGLNLVYFGFRHLNKI